MTEVPEQVKKQLLDYPFVTAVGSGYGRGERHENGEKAAVAFVTEKKQESELEEEQLLPKQVEGWKVDVQQVGSLGIEPATPEKVQDTGEVETTGRHRPAPQGVSIGHPDTSAGTPGFIAWEEVDRNGITVAKPRGVTNNHVAAATNNASEGDKILQPGKHDGGDRNDRIGQLEGYIPIEDEDNKVDAAWYSIDGRNMVSYIPSIGVPEETSEIEVGEQLRKFGRTTGLEKGKVLSKDARVRVNYDTGTKEFTDQILVESISAPGDSGSAVVNQQGDLVGLLFAGSSKVTVVNQIGDVLEETGLELTPSDVYDA